MVILLLFNEKTLLNLKEIIEKTKLSKEDIVREIYLLVKYKILQKYSEKKQGEDDIYAVNEIPIQVPFIEVQPISLLQNTEMKKKVIESIDSERKYLYDKIEI